MRFSILLAAGLLTTTQAVAQEKPVLTVLTYDSFVADWGPGPAIETAFEETCGCDLQFVAAGDGAALLARVRLEGALVEIQHLPVGAVANRVREWSATVQRRAREADSPMSSP